MTTNRLEAFSDGIFAIAATLLVLDLHVPVAGRDGELLGELARLWPTYATYIVSFVTIGIMWVNHHAMFANVERVDWPLLFLNLLLLLVVAVIPFPTSLLGAYVTAGQDSHIAAAVYGGVMVLMSVAFQLLWRYVSRDGGPLLAARLEPRQARASTLLFSVGLVAYVLGIAVAWVSAPLSLLLYAAVAVYYMFPWLPGAHRASAGGAEHAKRPPG